MRLNGTSLAHCKQSWISYPNKFKINAAEHNIQTNKLKYSRVSPPSSGLRVVITWIMKGCF